MMRSRTVFLVYLLFARDALAEATIELYSREGCPRCAEARSFLAELARARPGLQVAEHDVARDRVALQRLRGLAERAGIATPGVPAIAVDDRVVIGFDRAVTPERVLKLLEGDDTPAGSGAICELEASACEDLSPQLRVVDLPMVGRFDVDRFGMPLFTVVVGLIDGFNPCATWVLVFLLAMLVNLKDRSRMALIAGTPSSSPSPWQPSASASCRNAVADGSSW
jgi:glutaredoxin